MIKMSLRDFVSSINQKTERKYLNEGTYNMKLAFAEKTKSQKGRPMARLTFECIDPDKIGAQVRHYTMLDDIHENEAWRYATLLNTALVAYGISEAKLNDEDCEDLGDVLDNAVAILGGKKYSGKNPVKPITLIRKSTDKVDANGNLVYKDIFVFGDANANANANANADANANANANANADGENSFYAALNE